MNRVESRFLTRHGLLTAVSVVTLLVLASCGGQSAQLAPNTLPQLTPIVAAEVPAEPTQESGLAPIIVATISSAAPTAAPAQPTVEIPAPTAVPEVGDAASGRPDLPAVSGDGMSILFEGGSNGRKEVALTFDAGADRGYAAEILDYLASEGIPATFGMTGKWASENPDLVQRMASEGHQLINHTWTHGSITGANTGEPQMTREQLAEELSSTEQVISELTGYELKPWFRPPYGDYNAETLTWLAELGYTYTAMWTCDTRGWAGWTANEIVDYCTSTQPEDDIILMHVGASAVGDFEALPGLVQHYRDNGYAFVTVEQMVLP